ELPETGGMGTTLFTIGGLILMAGAAALLMARKKTEN
ncbi:MAG: LPXTG cell wall anchor domain-containing protein, partial [Firmicutes bacterium]|nr:LPXTG cell wall anchor domain-containing protein [Bacillota bacterium]